MDLKQLRNYVIKPSLEAIGLYSEDAEELLVATAAVESGCGKFVKQKNNGPACGIYQMEPPTFRDAWAHLEKSKFYSQAMNACHFSGLSLPGPEEMITNLKFSTIMARIHYYHFPDPIPNKEDTFGIWKLYKKRWNTSLGATDEKEFMAAYKMVING